MIKITFDDKDIIELKGVMEQIYHKLRSDVPTEMLKAVENATNAAFTIAGEAVRFEDELPVFTTFEHFFSVSAKYIMENKGDKGIQDLARYIEYANQIIQRMVQKSLEDTLAVITNLKVVKRRTTKGLDEIRQSLRAA